jgi:hypothetical protein
MIVSLRKRFHSAGVRGITERETAIEASVILEQDDLAAVSAGKVSHFDLDLDVKASARAEFIRRNPQRAVSSAAPGADWLID